MKIFAYFICAIIVMIPSYAFAGKVIQGIIDAGTYGEIIKCAFPNTVVIDGKLDDQAWKYASWHIIEAKDASVPAANNDDASIKFAVCADDKYIYVGAEITDNKVQSGENTACDVWNDDSIEIYIDGGNEKAATYDINDAQISVGADFIGEKPDVKVAAALLGGCVGTTQGPSTETVASATKTGKGWNIEIGVPLKNSGWKIEPKNGSIIGFNVQYNDDDNGAGRDYKLIWCVNEIKQGEGSWSNPSLFAELQFIEANLAVSPGSKLIAAWSAIKSE